MVFPYVRAAMGTGLLWVAAGLTLAQDVELAPTVPGAPAPIIQSPGSTVPGGSIQVTPRVDAPPNAPLSPQRAGTPSSNPSALTWTPTHHWTAVGGAPGGDMMSGPRVGNPYYWNAPGSPSVGADGGTFGWNGSNWNGYGWGDAYSYHFGPGFHRNANYGHYRFPYHTYRAPWYFKGPVSYNRDTNYPW